MQPAPPTPMDSQDLLPASAEYRRLRRRYWRFVLLVVGPFVLFGAPAIALDGRIPKPITGVLFALTAVPGIVGWAGGLITWLTILNWPCPRCGRRFVLSFTSSWPTNNCKHCRLYLPPPPAAAHSAPREAV